MTGIDIPNSYDPPEQAKAEVQIYTEALAAKRNVVSALMRRDRLRSLATVFIAGYAIVATWAATYAIGNEKVYVYQIERGMAGLDEVSTIAPVYKASRRDIINDARMWVFHMRSVSIDPIVNQKFAGLAESRIPLDLRHVFKEVRAAGAMGPNQTRDVDLDSFGWTQLSSGEDGYWSFLIEWTEMDFQNLAEALPAPRRMLANLTFQMRPATRAERKAGNADGMWIVAFDLQRAAPTVVSEAPGTKPEAATR